MRLWIIIAAILVIAIGGAVIHLQATDHGPIAAGFEKSEPIAVFLMGAAHVDGLNDTRWRTSLEVCNFGGVSRTFELGFLHRGEANLDPPTVDLSLTSGRCVKYPDAVVSVFGFDEAVGTIRLAAEGDGIVAVARTYNETPGGTYGTSLVTGSVNTAIGENESAVLVHLSQSASDGSGFRTNLELLNLTGLEIDAEVALYNSDGSNYGMWTTTLEPFEYGQKTRIFRQVTEAEVVDGFAMVRTTTPGGALLAAASLIDNRTGDTTAIESSEVPNTERWLEPQNMGPVINSAGSEWYPVFARDGSFMIFVATGRGGYGSGDLYISRNVNGEWQMPENMGTNVNTSGMESAPFLSADDRTLYYITNEGGSNIDVFSCPLENGVPGPRTRLPEPINKGSLDCCPVLSPDGNTMFICSDRPGGYGDLDVWMAERVGGVWQEPVNLGAHINTPWMESPRWLSDDGRTLIIDSNQPGRVGGSDLWEVTRNGGEWLAPVNVGTPVNSWWDEWGPGFLGNDGAVRGRIFFGSGRDGGYGGWDIWYSDYGFPVKKTATADSTFGPVRVPVIISAPAGVKAAASSESPPVGNGCCSSGGT